MLALTLAVGAARAQSTPEAIIGHTPDLPSVAHLIANSDNEAASASIKAFNEKLAELHEKMNEATDRILKGGQDAANADAERLVQQQTGRSIAELQKMSKAEQQAMGQEMAQKKVAAAGLGNLSLSQLKALKGKSDDEIMAAMTAGGATIGGLTPAEIKAMEKMTDAQKAAYLQQGDRMKRMKAAAPSAQQSRDARAQVRNAKAQADDAAEMQKITERWQEIDRLNGKDIQAVAARCAEIAAKYDPQINAIVSKGYFDGLSNFTAAQIEDAAERVGALTRARDTENYTLWRDMLSKMQGRIKTKMADMPRYDELLAQKMADGGLTATAQNTPSIGFGIAKEYLDLTGRVTSLPEINQ